MTGDVTVVVPTILGREALLDRALASVRAQTVQPMDVIVVYDRDRKGAWWARNIGAAQVETTFVCFLDDDDQLQEDGLELLLAGQEESGADLVYGCTEVVGGRDPLAVSRDGVWVNPCGVPFGPEQERHLRYQGSFIPIGWLSRAGMIKAVGGFPPSGGPGREEDYQLLLKLRNFGARFHHIPVRTYRYYIHDANTGGGYQGTGASNKEAFRER